MIDQTRHLRQLLFALLAVWCSVLLPAHVAAAQTELQDEDIAAIRAAAEALGDDARQRLQPLPEGETRAFKAVVMATQGRAQWRGDAEVPWKDAAVNDLLDPGAMIRTGRGSSMVLRAGQNATILVDANTRLLLPQMIQEGQTLRTAVQLTRGRADFKVDRVGLTNDFSVVTPSATLAVRGTGYAARYGGLNGTEVSASRMNEMFAVELRYFLAQFTYYLSGGATSTETHNNPVVAELFKTFGPPRILSALIEDKATPDLLIDSFERNPVYYERAIDLALTALSQIEDLPIFDEPDDDEDYYEFQFDYDFSQFQFEGVTGAGQVVEFICGYLNSIFDLYGQYLVRDGLGDEGISQPWSDIADLCYGQEVYDEQDLINILSIVVAYCAGRHDDPEDAGLCVLDFIAAFGDVWIENWEGE